MKYTRRRKCYFNLNNSNRKKEELEEIIEYFADSDLVMVKAALEKLNR